MRFALMTEPQQGMSYADQVAIARRAEAAGFEAFFRSDHYQSFPGPAGRPTTDAWAVLAGLARDVQRIRLGVLVSPVTFRLPGVLAKTAATVDEMSGGRLELGLGAGWHDEEHAKLGIPFPPIAERADMLEEQLAIVHGLWEGPDGWSFEGRFYRVQAAHFAPRPNERATHTGPGRPNIIVGGDGSARSMRMAVRWADEFNLTGADPALAAAKFAALDEACRVAGRDPATLRRSAMVGVLVGADEAEVDRRSRALLRAVAVSDEGAADGSDGGAGDGASGAGSGAEPDDPAEWWSVRRPRWIVGTPDEARATVRAYAAAGVERLMLQDFLPWDLEMVDLLGRELVGRV